MPNLEGTACPRPQIQVCCITGLWGEGGGKGEEEGDAGNQKLCEQLLFAFVCCPKRTKELRDRLTQGVKKAIHSHQGCGSKRGGAETGREGVSTYFGNFSCQVAPFHVNVYWFPVEPTIKRSMSCPANPISSS